MAAGREFDAGLLYGSSRHDALIEAARRLPELGAARILLDDPAGLLQPHRAGELVAELRELSGLPGRPLLPGRRPQRPRARARGGAGRRRPDRLRRLSGRARDAPHLGRVARAGARRASGTTRASTSTRSGEAADLVDEHIGDMPITPLVPRVSVRAARRKLPLGLVVDRSTRSCAAAARATGSTRCSTRSSAFASRSGSPPLAAPIGQIVASQALVNVLGANRYGDDRRRAPRPRARPLRPHARADRPGARSARSSCSAPAPHAGAVDIDALRERAQGLAASEEELLLLALFGDEAEPLLRSIRRRAGGEEPLPTAGVARSATSRSASVVRIVQETGVGEITVEEDGDARQRPPVASTRRSRRSRPGRRRSSSCARRSRPRRRRSCASRARWSARSTARPKPGAPPFVEEGDPVSPGQVLCILEAMKLMNEVKAEIEAIVRRIHVADAQPVEYGQLLFELEPLERPAGRDLAAMFRRSCREPRRDRRPRDPRAARARRRGGRRLLDRRRRRAARAARRRGRPRRARRRRRESYLRIPSIVAAAVTTGCDAVHPGLRLPLREPGVRRGLRRQRPRLRRAAGGGDGDDGRQDRGPASRCAPPTSRPSRAPTARRRSREARARGRRDRLPGHAEGGGRRRRQGDAARRGRRRARGRVRRGGGRGGGGVRRRDALPREGARARRATSRSRCSATRTATC